MPLEVFLSRSRSFANVVTLYGERGTLTVPIQFAHTPTLRLDSDDFFVSLPIVTARPTDQPGCLLMAHEEFVSAAQGSRQSESNRLEASRFVMLTAIIDAIARHGRTE